MNNAANETNVITSRGNRDNDVIGALIAELGRDGLDNKTVIELMRGLRREYPRNNVILQMSEVLDLEDGQERGDNEFPWILFSLNDTAYGINSKYVLSIEILGEITPIVDAPHYSPGITRSRGEMIDILDMRAVFGSGDYRSAKAGDPDAIYMMVVAEINEIKRGLIVDEIISVEHITKFEEGVMCNDGRAASQYVGKIARREKSDEPVLVLKPDSLIAL